jgi:hypothetical protein
VKSLQAEKLDRWHTLKEDDSLFSSIRYRQSAAAVKLELLKEKFDEEYKILTSSDLGLFYKYVNSRLSHRDGIAPLKDSSGIFAFTDADKAELLNCTFTKNRTVDNGILPDVKPCSYSNTLGSVMFDAEKIYSKLINLKIGSAPGPDGIPAIFFKNLASVLAYPLAVFYDRVFNSESIPDVWKLANVTPIFKKGPSGNPENYRPISLTNIICKVFESIIKDQLMDFLTKNRVITANQHSYLAHHSTTTNLLESLNDWTRNLDVGLDTDIIYIDFAKAFDSVSVPKLIHRLSFMGICNPLLSCIESFLKNRSQRVIVGKSASSYKPVISGVPQGSVLGPILFILYVNEIPEISAQTDTSKLFADDVKRYSLRINSADFQAGLDQFCKWCSDWQLTIAPAKCCAVQIRRYEKRTQNKIDFKIGGYILPVVSEIKDLGVLIDNQLDFSAHIKGVVSKAKQRIYLLFKCFNSRNMSLLLKAYNSYILPLFDYCSTVWSPTKLCDIDLLENVQRNFTKRLQGMEEVSYEERLLKCGLESLELRRLRKDLALCYQIVNGLISLEFKHFFMPDPNCKTRGNRQKLKIPKLSHSTARTNFFAVRIVPVWNSLTDEIILCGNYHNFCKQLDSVDLSKHLKRSWDISISV